MIKPEQVARLCHEVNRAYCESIGDRTQKPWDDAEEWQKTSAINGVKFRMANPEATAADMHENWMKEKHLEGWVHGAVKDVEKKTHPCLLPYEMLPEDQRFKDYLFSSVVNAAIDFNSSSVTLPGN